MGTTVQVSGDVAAPCRAVSDLVVKGKAINVYGFNTVEEAIAAGFSVEAGPVTPVHIVTAQELAAGKFIPDGDPSASPVFTAPASENTLGDFAIPVIVLNGWTG